MARRRKASAIEVMAPNIREDKRQVLRYDIDNLSQQQKTEALVHLFLSYKAWLRNKFRDAIQ